MSTTVSLPDGTSLEFPDGTDPAVIQRAVAQARMHVQAASAGPSFSDVTGSASSTATDDLLAKKRAQMAQARQIAAAQGLSGNVPVTDQSPVSIDQARDFLSLSSLASNVAAIPEIPGRILHAVVDPFAKAAAYIAPMRAGAGPGIAETALAQNRAAQEVSAPSFDLPVYHEAVAEPAERVRALAQQHLADTTAGLPTPVAASIFWGSQAGAEAADPLIWGPTALASRAARGVEGAEALSRATEGALAGDDATEAAYLARRAEALRSMPGATEAPLRPGAIADAMQPERSILQVGEHADRAAQDAALGMRAAPEDAPELARVALALDEHAAPSLPRQEPPSLAEIFGEPERVVGGGTPPGRDLVPAGIGSDGRIYYGARGDAHFHVAEKFPEGAPWRDMGFAGPNGKYLTREEALATIEPGMKGYGLDANSYREGYLRWRDAPPEELPDFASSEGKKGAQPLLRNALTGEELPLDTPAAARGPLVAPPSPVPYTGTTQAIIEAEQRAAGLPVSERLASQGPAWDEAARIIEQDPEAPRRLAQEVAANPRPVSDVERHMLLQDRARLRPTYYAAMDAEEAALASGDQAQAAVAKANRLAVEDAYQANADAAHHASSEWGKSGNAAQQLAAEDYSAPELVRRYRLANLGEEAPDPVRKKLVDISRQLEDANARLAAAEEKAQNLEAQRMVYNEAQNAAREVRSRGRAAVAAGLDQEYSALAAEWRKATGLAQAGVNPEQAVILAKMARNRVRAGVTNLQDVVDGVFQDARPHLATLEPQDVRDAIAGAGPIAQKTARKQAVSDFSVLRREARVLNALDSAHAKLAAAGDSKAQAIAQKEITRWETELDKIRGGARQGGGPLSDPERIRASLSRNAARQAELRDQIASGTIIPKTRAPVADYALLQARAETEKLQRAADAIIAKRELQNRGWLQKGLDLTAATARFTPLTSVTGTLPKLAAAASWRSLVMRPAEQLLSVADPYLPLIRELSAEAPVEGGGVGLNALKKSYQGFFSQEARAEAIAHLRGEEGPLALALGKPRMPTGAPAFMDYPSHLHAALKSPAVVAGYNWAMEMQAARLARAGVEVTPELRMTMESNAWDVALRDILLNDNAAVERFNLALQKLPQDTTATRVGIATGRTLLPIVKVATNYPLQATDYLFGLPKFGVRAGKVIYRGTQATAGQEARTLADIVRAGIQASPPGYADQIMRNLKRGRLGAALAGLVLTGAVEVGGYYRKGEHRSESDLQPGEIRIGGSDAILQLPHNVLHSPPMEAMQVVGTFKRSKNFGQGLGTSALGLAEQTPFFEESMRLGRDLPNNPAKFAGMVGRQISEPPDIQKLARVLDQEKERSTPQKVGQALGWAGLKVGPWEVPEIKARKRTPHGGFWEQLWKQEELGIPGLRDNVR